MPSIGSVLLIAQVPEAWQWTGLGATLAGTLLSLWAAISAVRARRAAEAARAAAVQLGRTAQSQLANIVSQIRGSKAKDETKLGRIQVAVGEASAALNSVAGHRRAQLEP